MLVVDNFIDDFDAMRNHCDALSFSGEVNPFDGVEYPGISFDIPEDVKREVEQKVSEQLHRDLDFIHFMRLTMDGVDIPHGAHDDAIMADVVVLLYLNRGEDCAGGTELVRHIDTGMDASPTHEEVDIWRRDTNRADSWEVTDMAEMRPNRAVFIQANRMHRASTPSGFGDCAANGRLVYSCFARYA